MKKLQSSVTRTVLDFPVNIGVVVVFISIAIFCSLPVRMGSNLFVNKYLKVGLIYLIE